MASEERTESTSHKVKRSLSQLMIAFAVLGLVAGLAVMSPDGRFAGFALAALCGAVPVVIGPSGMRKYGAVAAAVGTIGIMVIAGSGEGSPYRNKARVQAVYDYGVKYCEASADHRSRMKAWPAGLDGLGAPKKPRTVSTAVFGADGTITLVLSFPPVKDGALVFTPSGGIAPITWTCRGRDIPEVLLPSACKAR